MVVAVVEPTLQPEQVEQEAVLKLPEMAGLVKSGLQDQQRITAAAEVEALLKLHRVFRERRVLAVAVVVAQERYLPLLQLRLVPPTQVAAVAVVDIAQLPGMVLLAVMAALV